MLQQILKNKAFQKTFPLICILATTIICFLFALQFEIYEGGADNYIHYRVSRYAFTYPELFLDHWGKPVFTLLGAPFAQFGFKGLLFFNVLCGVLACFFAYKVALQLKLSQAWSAAMIAIAMPVYFIMMASAMTEVLFSLILVLSIYFILSEKYVVGAILFSLLFLVRTEGYILYPFVIFVFAVKKQWKAIPFLGVGFLFYSIIGWFHFGDFLWLINQNPYGDASDLYGTGEALYFVKQYKLLFGKPIAILLIIGMVIAGIQFLLMLFKERKIKTDFILIEILLLVYFAAHSYVWWSGTGASAGLIRVMAAIVPLAAISATRSIDFVSRYNPLPKIYYSIGVGLICIYFFTIPFKMLTIPFQYGEREKTIYASVDWMKNSRYSDVKVYFYEPLIYFLLDRDPFDHSVIKELVDDREHPEKSVKPGELVFYDMHFGPNEGGLPLERLMDNPQFKLVNYFEPLTEMIVLGGYKYGVLIFERVLLNTTDNRDLLAKYKMGKTKTQLWQTLFHPDKKITADEFTPLLETEIKNVRSIESAQLLKASIQYKFPENPINFEVYLVVSIEADGEAKIYNAVPLFADGQFKELENNAVLSQELNGNEILKIYIWNKTGQTGSITKLDVYTVEKTY